MEFIMLKAKLIIEKIKKPLGEFLIKASETEIENKTEIIKQTG